MALNAGLRPSEIAERVNRLQCPKCGTRLQILVRREWAACSCCGVDYAKAEQGGRDVILSRFLPDGAPACRHYHATPRFTA